MKIRYLSWAVCLILLCIIPAGKSFAEYDPGARDTVRLGNLFAGVTGPPMPEDSGSADNSVQ